MNEDSARAVEIQDPWIGRVLSDRYRILRLIGRGGMGVVYLAEHVLIRRKLAIKLLHSPLTASDELIQRFHREARAAATVGNEHIVDVTDMGRLEDGTYYIVLEYLEGLDLAALIDGEGPMTLARAVDVGIQICEGLTAVHRAGIVHRDLKPENIVLVRRRRSDFVKILDFGICKVIHERPLTATGVALGTPQFMSPEQLEARPEVDRRTDVYAVGAILFFAISGRLPFESKSLPHLLMNIWSEPPPKLRAVRPDAPEALERVIARALEKHPKDRFPDCEQLAAALAAIAPAVGALPKPDRAWAYQSGVFATEPTCAVPSAPPIAKQDPPLDEAVTRKARGKRVRYLTASTVFAGSVAGLAGLIYALAASVIATPEAALVPARSAPRVESAPEITSDPPTRSEAILAASPSTPEAQPPRTASKRPRPARPARSEQPVMPPPAAPVEPVPAPEPPVAAEPTPEPTPHSRLEPVVTHPLLVPGPRELKPVF